MDELAEKIISNVDRQFSRDPLIDEYDILPMLESTTNRNPVYVVDHKLAIEAWAAHLMFCSAVEGLRQWRLAPKTDAIERLCSLTRAAVLVVADHSTAWNIRKELIEQGRLDVNSDLTLADLVLTKRPKSDGVFTHRRWLLHKAFTDTGVRRPVDVIQTGCPTLCHPDVASHVSTKDVNLTSEADTRTHVTCCSDALRPLPPHSELRHAAMRRELNVAHRAAEKYSNNYYAWNHRLWVIDNLSCCRKQTIVDELSTMRQFVTTHVSDHSGFHYRQFLIDSLMQIDGMQRLGADLESRSRLDEELELTRELLEFYPGHEAIFYHRRYVMHRLLRCLEIPNIIINRQLDREADAETDLVAAKKTKLVSTTMTSIAGGGCTGSDDGYESRLTLLSRETAYCRRLLGDPRTAKLSWHVTLVERHLAWTDRLIKMPNSVASDCL